MYYLFVGYGSWLHGEAVGLGIYMAADLSWRLNWIDKSILDRTYQLLKRSKLPLQVPEGMKPENFMDLMAVDKKV